MDEDHSPERTTARTTSMALPSTSAGEAQHDGMAGDLAADGGVAQNLVLDSTIAEAQHDGMAGEAPDGGTAQNLVLEDVESDMEDVESDGANDENPAQIDALAENMLLAEDPVPIADLDLAQHDGMAENLELAQEILDLLEEMGIDQEAHLEELEENPELVEVIEDFLDILAGMEIDQEAHLEELDLPQEIQDQIETCLICYGVGIEADDMWFICNICGNHFHMHCARYIVDVSENAVVPRRIVGHACTNCERPPPPDRVRIIQLW